MEKKIGRNEPCPCGSGKKFKNCHLGREGELFLIQTELMKKQVAQKITALPEADYGRAKEIANALNIKELTGNTDITGIKFVDFNEYIALESFDKGNLKEKHYECGGLIVNPMKTEETDTKNIYIAITPNINDSSLIHELAHVLDFLGGSGLLPGSTFQVSLRTGIPMEHLDHLKEFADWLDYLKEQFDIELNAEDKIISYLNEHNMLIETSLLRNKDINSLVSQSKKILDFLMTHKEDINGLIRDRVGYLESASS